MRGTERENRGEMEREGWRRRAGRGGAPRVCDGTLSSDMGTAREGKNGKERVRMVGWGPVGVGWGRVAYFPVVGDEGRIAPSGAWYLQLERARWK